MKINKNDFPILECIENNYLTDKIYSFLGSSGYEVDGITDIMKSLRAFFYGNIKIDCVSTVIHEQLLETPNFLKAKVMLQDSDEATGLLLLHDTIYSDLSNVPEYVDVNTEDYPISAIFYTWTSFDNLQKRLGTFEEEWGDDKGREILIIPIHNNKITQATSQYHMICNDELYGTEYSEKEGRCWYGKIHDYVMSFLIYQEINLENNRGQKQKIETNVVNFI